MQKLTKMTEIIISKEVFMKELENLLEQFNNQLIKDKSDSPVSVSIDKTDNGHISIHIQQVEL